MAAAQVSRSRLVTVVAIGLLLVVAAMLAQDHGAGALSGTTGPVNVTVTPTSGLTDGQSISISATTSSGTLSEIRAHVCVAGADITNTYDFGFQGTFCTKSAPGAGDFQTAIVLANTASGSLSFKAGIGTANWNDEFDGTPHTLTCDSTHPCDLVVQFQSSVAPGTYFFTAPLTFAGGGTTTTSTVVTTVPPSSTSSTTTSSTSTTTTSTTSTTTTTKPPTSSTTTTTSPGSTTTTTPTSTTTTTVAPTNPTTATSFPISVAGAGGGSGGGSSGGGLALTGANSRDLASAALLMTAVGLLLLGQYTRRRET